MASPMAEFGIAIDGRAPIADISAQARAAEEGGATTLWLACHLYLRDPVTMAALALGATRELRIALMAMSPYSTHPVYIAMAAASLDEMYPGRVILCLGSGAPADLKAAGIESPKPLVAIGEAARICRSLFKGEMTDFQGQMFKVAGRRLANGGRDIPIMVAASRPNMLKLAGRETDGVLISAATMTAFWPWLKAKFGFTDSQIRKYTYNLAPFILDPNAIQEGYLTSEPYTVEQEAHFTPKVFLLSDAGYPGYANMVLTTNGIVGVIAKLQAIN